MDRMITQIVSLLEAKVKAQRGIKRIYKGDPFWIPKASLPAITVSPILTKVASLDTANDVDNYTIAVNLIFDSRDEFNANEDQYTGLFKVVQIMEERVSGTSNALKADTILGVMRKDFYQDANFNVKITEDTITYGFTSFRGFPAIEVSLQMLVQSKPYLRV